MANAEYIPGADQGHKVVGVEVHGPGLIASPILHRLSHA